MRRREKKAREATDHCSSESSSFVEIAMSSHSFVLVPYVLETLKARTRVCGRVKE
jgi:hypothetical protein